MGSAVSDGTLPLPLHHAAVHNAPSTKKIIYISKTWGVSTGGCKCLSKHPNPTLGRIRKDVFIKNQSSKSISLFEIRKWQDNFLVTVHGFLMHWQAKCHCKQPDIRNIMGGFPSLIWEVLVTYLLEWQGGWRWLSSRNNILFLCKKHIDNMWSAP